MTDVLCSFRVGSMHADEGSCERALASGKPRVPSYAVAWLTDDTTAADGEKSGELSGARRARAAQRAAVVVERGALVAESGELAPGAQEGSARARRGRVVGCEASRSPNVMRVGCGGAFRSGRAPGSSDNARAGRIWYVRTPGGRRAAGEQYNRRGRRGVQMASGELPLDRWVQGETRSWRDRNSGGEKKKAARPWPENARTPAGRERKLARCVLRGHSSTRGSRGCARCSIATSRACSKAGAARGNPRPRRRWRLREESEDARLKANGPLGDGGEKTSGDKIRI